MTLYILYRTQRGPSWPGVRAGAHAHGKFLAPLLNNSVAQPVSRDGYEKKVKQIILNSINSQKDAKNKGLPHMISSSPWIKQTVSVGKIGDRINKYEQYLKQLRRSTELQSLFGRSSNKRKMPGQQARAGPLLWPALANLPVF